MTDFGFIILRHVNNELTNKYWIHCYHCIRKYYPENIIIIIDDDSDYTFITKEFLYKTIVINSEYKKRGELLPYYYYLKNKFFDTAVILHDSVFINAPLHFNIKTYKILWDFSHEWDQIEYETAMLRVFNDKRLMNFYKNKSLWKGCFGGMSIITHDYLTFIQNKYDISKLLGVISTREDRMAFERVIACLLQIENKSSPVFGDIHRYCPWGITFNEKENYNHLPFIKVWTGR